MSRTKTNAELEKELAGSFTGLFSDEGDCLPLGPEEQDEFLVTTWIDNNCNCWRFVNTAQAYMPAVYIVEEWTSPDTRGYIVYVPDTGLERGSYRSFQEALDRVVLLIG